MPVLATYKTDTGRRRDHNEDYVWVNNQQGVYIVADGLGGHEAGDVASEIAAITTGQIIVEALEAGQISEEDMKLMVINAIETANETVSEASVKAMQSRPMGATIVLAVVTPPVAYIAHAGDARAYLVRDNKLHRLTEDDSWVAQLIAAGIYSEEDARQKEQLHFITKAVGQGSPVDPVFDKISVAPGDWLLLCSDGLWNMLSDAEILAEFVQHNDDMEKLVDAYIDAANTAGGKDNIAVITIKIT